MRKVMLLAPENFCGILRNALAPKYITLPCSSAGAAEKILAAGPDALILCLPLPGLCGLAFLREHLPSLPPVVIVLTAYFDDGLLGQLQELGVSAVVPMPCHLSHLEALLTKKCPSR